MSELLATPRGTMTILDQFGIRAKKKYGQNFLIQRSVVDQIIEAADITKDDCVLEIGPGIGTMTQLLSEAAGHVVAVEIDEGLEKVLEVTLDDKDNVTVLFQDILKTDLKAISAEYNEGRPLKCVANLPYYITTPILLQLFEEADCFDSITIMVQKEVADRILATEKDKEYGALSLAVRYYSEPERVCIVPPGCFIPRPGVDSAVLQLRIRKEAPVDVEERFLFALIRAAFNQRRKTLANALSHGLQNGAYAVDREMVQKALLQMGLSETIRGEKLSLEQFAELARQLGNMLEF
jgi:16S rRNA (adenine1518-N6/adenine1519-N6)-dimethyltransferase